MENIFVVQRVFTVWGQMLLHSTCWSLDLQLNGTEGLQGTGRGLVLLICAVEKSVFFFLLYCILRPRARAEDQQLVSLALPSTVVPSSPPRPYSLILRTNQTTPE